MLHLAVGNEESQKVLTLFPQDVTYVVGGAVRDAMLGQTPNDIDLVMPREQIDAVVRAARKRGITVVPLDPARQTYRLIAPDGKCEYDLSPIKGRDIYADLAKRDLTINALAVPLRLASSPLWSSHVLVSDVGDASRALLDIRSHPPVIRFTYADAETDDPLRLIRAVRAAAKYSGALPPDTLARLRAGATRGDLSRVAGERIAHEILTLLSLPPCQLLHGMFLLKETGLLGQIFPSVDKLSDAPGGATHQHDAWRHTLRMMVMASALLGDEDVLSLSADLFPGSPDLQTALRERVSEARRRLTHDWPQMGLFPVLFAKSRALARHGNRIASAIPEVQKYGLPAVFALVVLMHDAGKSTTHSVGEDGRHHYIHHEEASVQAWQAAVHRLKLSRALARFGETIIANHMEFHHRAQGGLRRLGKASDDASSATQAVVQRAGLFQHTSCVASVETGGGMPLAGDEMLNDMRAYYDALGVPVENSEDVFMEFQQDEDRVLSQQLFGAGVSRCPVRAVRIREMVMDARDFLPFLLMHSLLDTGEMDIDKSVWRESAAVETMVLARALALYSVWQPPRLPGCLFQAAHQAGLPKNLAGVFARYILPVYLNGLKRAECTSPRVVKAAVKRILRQSQPDRKAHN